VTIKVEEVYSDVPTAATAAFVTSNNLILCKPVIALPPVAGADA